MIFVLDYFTGFDGVSRDFTVHEYGEEQCKKGYAFGPYIRQAYFLHYVYSGKGVFEAEGKTYHLQKGQMFLICPGQLTYYKADDDDPWLYRWVSFDGGSSRMLLNSAHLSEKSPIFTDDEEMHAGRALEKMVSEGSVSFCRTMALFWDFADKISRGMSVRKNSNEYVERTKAYIHSHYMEEVSVHEMAESMGIDRSYLSRLFHKYEGISPQEYLIMYRLGLAKSLLTETKLHISEVAKMVGYSDAMDFSKIFKQKIGETPSHFRKQV